MVRGGVPHRFRWRAPVWQADLDAFGELRSSALLRFLQEVATRASTAAGFDPAYYERTQTMWLVRRTTLALLAPVRYGEDLEAETWIADFRRVRSQRLYDVRSAGRPVARASTDWVFVERASGRPRRIPAEMERGLAPEGAPVLERAAFAALRPSPAATQHERRVEIHELDALQHVNNAIYAHWIEQAALDAAAAAGWPLEAQLAAGGRFRAVCHDLEYRDAAVYGDALSIVTWPVRIDPLTLERHAVVLRTTSARPALLAHSHYDWIEVRSGDSTAMPEVLRAALARGGQ